MRWRKRTSILSKEHRRANIIKKKRWTKDGRMPIWIWNEKIKPLFRSFRVCVSLSTSINLARNRYIIPFYVRSFVLFLSFFLFLLLLNGHPKSGSSNHFRFGHRFGKLNRPRMVGWLDGWNVFTVPMFHSFANESFRFVNPKAENR